MQLRLSYTFAMAGRDENSHHPSDITRLIGAWQSGDAGAAEPLCRLLYRRLHQIAVGRLRGEARQVTLQPTVLVHEVVIELLRNAPQINDQAHLLALASRMMRQFLIDEARRRGAQRRGGDQLQVTLDGERLGGRDSAVDLVELDSALTRLEAIDERKARAIELYYFGGLDYNELAAELEISRATAHRELRFARAFIAAELGAAAG
ncbi:MAG: ECF-type sigma factor [Wenzhouxiangella sp.]